ncbi:MAG: nucleotidyltransferase domain-containing protein [Promethearchaeota archaeon]
MIHRLKEAKEEHLYNLHEELNRIKAKLIKMGAHKIILFGSAAREELGLMSDIDLIVVIDSNKDFIERLAYFYQEIQPVDADLLIYTPLEFIRMMSENLFIQHVLKQGKIIYERTKQIL